MNMLLSLCESCAQTRVVISGTGSRFLMCQKSLVDKHYPKYPPQPVLRCAGFQSIPNQDSDFDRT